MKPSPSRIDAIAQPRRPAPHLPHDQVQQGRAEQRRRPEQEREPPAPGVRHDPGRDLEEHLPTVKNALTVNAWVLSSPASSRNSVLMPQMNDAASVVNSVRTR